MKGWPPQHILYWACQEALWTGRHGLWPPPLLYTFSAHFADQGTEDLSGHSCSMLKVTPSTPLPQASRERTAGSTLGAVDLGQFAPAMEFMMLHRYMEMWGS